MGEVGGGGGAGRVAYPGGSSPPVYLVFAQVDIPKGTILGEYTGHVKLDSTVKQEETAREEAADGLSLPMAYNYTYGATESWSTGAPPLPSAEVASTVAQDTHGDGKLTVDAFSSGNHLRYINDYRENLERFCEVGAQGRRRPNVEPFEVWYGGLPHILLVTIVEIAQYEEVLVDYGDDYWSEFLKQGKRAQRIRELHGEREAMRAQRDKALRERDAARDERDERDDALKAALMATMQPQRHHAADGDQGGGDTGEIAQLGSDWT